MAMTIKQLLSFSWMSQASYLDYTGLVSNASAGAMNAKLTSTGQINPGNIFSPTQATTFTDPANGFSFINYTPNDANREITGDGNYWGRSPIEITQRQSSDRS